MDDEVQWKKRVRAFSCSFWIFIGPLIILCLISEPSFKVIEYGRDLFIINGQIPIGNKNIARRISYMYSGF